MANTRNHPALLLIGVETLHCAAVESLLRLWALSNGLAVYSLTPDECGSAAAFPEHIRLAVYCTEAASIQTPQAQAQLQRIREAAPGAALVILSDNELRSEIIAAFRAGARGYISMNTNPGVALHALTFIFAGGSFVPPAVLDEMPALNVRSEDGTPGSPHDTALGFGAPSANGYDAAKAESGTGNGGSGMEVRGHLSALTGRQLEVLDHLCRGASNKVIGRKLGMAEATVKVHVRQIMHKLGASNRTQVALRALEQDFSGEEAPGKVEGHPIPAALACGSERLDPVHAIRASLRSVRISAGLDAPKPQSCQVADSQPVRR